MPFFIQLVNKVMYVGTLCGRSFTFGENPYEEHEERAEEHEENNGENTRESLKPTRFDYTCARTMKTKRDT